MTVGPAPDPDLQLSGNERKARSSESEDDDDEVEPPFRKQLRLHAAILVAGVEDVLWALYHDNKVSEGMTLPRCIAVLKAADELGAIRVLAAAQLWLGRYKFADRTAASSLYALPSGLLDHIPEAVKTRARHVLLDGLYDLEVTLADADARRRTLELPQEVFAALLCDDRTSVAHESTVAYAAMLYADVTLRADHVPDALARCVRLMRLTPAYAAGVAGAFPQWTARVMATAAACCESSAVCEAVRAEGDERLLAALGNISIIRGLSSVTYVSLRTHLRLDDSVGAVAARALQLQRTCEISATAPVPHYGFVWSLVLEAAVEGGRLSIGVYIRSQAHTWTGTGQSNTMPVTKRSCRIACRPQANGVPMINRGETVTTFCRDWGFIDFFDTAMSAWDPERLRRWADAYGKIAIKAKIRVL
ncbi:hypothetical protein JKP88DRAFT_284877 [Tribonema minus]|uniref:Uncharacterized protein n=1 Tax=Tribonema minus TaxID=303371 RepID=A0A835ZJC4_9STRA|nr:hypothetical protein JKP88DRAFT_284877 [Tribonema minus]